MKNLNIVLVVLSVFLFGFIGLPKQKELKNLQKEIKVLTTEKNKKSEEFKTIKAEFKDLKNSEKNVKHVIPNGSNQAKILEDLAAITKKTGIKISETIQFSETKLENQLHRIDTKFSISGARSQILIFLKNIESNNLLMGVDGFSINQSEDNETNFSVNLYSFYLSEPIE